MCEYGFVENEDFYSKLSKTENGGRPSVDYEISLDMAKQICMIQRTPEGKECRQYLIDLEKAWNTPEQVMARALRIADQTIANLKTQVLEMKPKADFFDTVADSKTAISMNEVAKVLNVKGYGRNNLFEFLRDNKVLDRWNIPYQRYVDSGCLELLSSTLQETENRSLQQKHLSTKKV